MRTHSPSVPSFLFVDADPRALAALRRLVRDLPGLKRFAQDVREAVRLIREAKPSVVVSGYGLPDGDGLCLLTGVRERLPGTVCALHTSHPPTPALEGQGITWMDRAAPPHRVLELLASLG